MLKLFKSEEPKAEPGIIDDPALLRETISGVEGRRRVAIAEGARLAAAAAAELDDEKAEELLRQARAQDRAGSRAEAEIEALRERLVKAERKRQERAFSKHKRELAAQAKRVSRAAQELAAANVAAIGAYDAATRELGSQVAERFLPRVHFAGIGLPDLVEKWCKETEGALEALLRVELPAPPSPAIHRTKAEVNAALTALPPNEFRGVVARTIGEGKLLDRPAGSPQRSVTADDGRVPPERSRDPAPVDDRSLLLPGEVRVVVRTTNYEGHPNTAGWVKRMPAGTAEIAARNGAVEIIEIAGGEPAAAAISTEKAAQ